MDIVRLLPTIERLSLEMPRVRITAKPEVLGPNQEATRERGTPENPWAMAFAQVADIYVRTILRFQLHRCVAGVSSPFLPLRSLSNLTEACADLVLLPLAEYRRNGRVIRGLRKGAGAFVRKV